MFACLNKYDWIIVLVNVIFFMIVQTLFFKFVASKQYADVLVSKIDLIKLFLSKEPEKQSEFNDYKNEYLKTNNEKALQQQRARDKTNKELTRKYCLNLILLGIVVLIVTVLFMKSKTQWNDVYTLSLVLVLLSYTTELCFFFFIVEKYEFVGDHYIIANIVDNVRKRSIQN